MVSGWLRFLRSEKGAYGAKHALVAGIVASALVFAASWLWQDVSALLAEIGCTQASGCVIKVERVAMPPAKDPALRPAAAARE